MAAVFPGAVATNADLIVAGNNDSSTLAVNLTAVDTTLIFVSSGIFSTSQAVVIGSEIILLGTVAGAIATGCTRGYAGTTAATHSVGETAQDLIIASHHNNLKDEIIAIQTAIGAELSNVSLGLLADNYQFTQTPSVSLSAGVAATVTLNPMPAGINAYSPGKHSLRITDLIGGSETVLITSRTATTITFTPANSHTSGNWNLGSATSGVQEAGNVGSSVQVRAGFFPMWAASRFSYAVNIEGAGDAVTVFSLQSPTMDLFIGSSILTVSNFGVISAIAYQSAGKCFSLENGGGTISAFNVNTTRCFDTMHLSTSIGGLSGNMVNCQCFGQVNNVLYYSCPAAGLVRMTSVYADGRYVNAGLTPLIATCNTAGAIVTRTAGSVFTNILVGGTVVINNVQYTVLSVDSPTQLTLTSSAGVQAGVSFAATTELLSPALVFLRGTLAGGIFSDLWFQAAKVHIVSESGSLPVNECIFTNCIFDQDSYSSVAAISAYNTLGLPAASSNSFRFVGCYINSYGYGVLAQFQAALSITNSKIVAFGIKPAVVVNTCTDLTIKDNWISQECGFGVTFAMDISGINARIFAVDNVIETKGGTMSVFLRDFSSAMTDLFVRDNVCTAATALLSSATIASSNCVVSGNNHNGANVSIVSAATITLPVYNQEDLVIITGLNNISTIVGGRNDRQVRFFVQDGFTFVAGASVATTVVAPAASFVTGTYNSSTARWYLR